jgi:hypothetical protein
LRTEGIKGFGERLVSRNEGRWVVRQCLSDQGGFADLPRTSDNNHEPWQFYQALSQDIDLATFEGHVYVIELIYSQQKTMLFQSASDFYILAWPFSPHPERW